MITPDAALKTMKDFKESLGIRAHSVRHGDELSYTLAGKSLALVLGNPERKVLAPCTGRASSKYAQQSLLRRYDSAAKDYLDTYPLKNAVTLEGISYSEREALTKILGNIPANVQDLFYVAVVRRHEHATVTGIGVDPQLTLHLINEGLLFDVAHDPEASHPIGPKVNANEGAQEITHSDSRAFVSGEGIAMQLANRLPAPSVFRSYD